MKEFIDLLENLTNVVFKGLNNLSEKITSGKHSVMIKTIIRVVLIILLFWLIGILFNAIEYLGVFIIYTVGMSGRLVVSTIWKIIVELTYALFIIVALYKLLANYKNNSKEKLLFKNKKKDDKAKDKFFSTANIFIKVLSIIILIPLFIVDIGALYVFGLLFGLIGEGINLSSLFIMVFGIILFVTSLILLVKSLLSNNDKIPSKFFFVTIVSIFVMAFSGILFVIETKDYKRVDSLTNDFKITTIRQQYKLDSKKKYIISNNGGLRKINVIYDDDLGSYMEVEIKHYTTSSIDTYVREGNKETIISYNQDLKLEFEDIEKVYNLVLSCLKEKRIYNYNLLKYGDITIRVSSEYKDNIKVANRVEND